jgi:hypothetical protein
MIKKDFKMLRKQHKSVSIYQIRVIRVLYSVILFKPKKLQSRA